MELSSTSNPVEDMCATVSKFQSARIGDKGYDYQEVRDIVAEFGFTAPMR